MKGTLRIVTATLIALSILAALPARGGILKSLDEELSTLVGKTDPYLVTVRGESGWGKLIATGIVFKEGGYVLTSSQAYDADKHEVTFKDGTSYPAEKVGVDRQTGLAVLKMTAENLKPPAWGKSGDLRSGSWIMVVGNSYGTPATVNFGVYEGKTDENLLRLDVAVSPGASGGAVLNTDGQVVAILIARQEGDESANLSDLSRKLYSAASSLKLLNLAGDVRSKAIAVPIEQAMDVAAELIENGRVRRGFLGISQRNLTPRELGDLDVEHGVMVVEVVDDSPAEKAGLEQGDVVTSADKKEIENISDLYGIVRSHKPGDEMPLEYFRDGESHSVMVSLDSTINDGLFGGWESKDSLPELKVGKTFRLPDKLDMEREIARLERQLKQLAEELKELRDRIKD